MTTTKVNSEFIAVNAISGTIIADGAITSTHLAANCVDSSELVTGSIDTIHIAANQVTAAKIVSDGVEHRHMHSNVISGLSTVTAVGGDYVLIGDTSDSNNLKKALISDFGVAGISSSADATAITIDSSEQVGIGTLNPSSILHIEGDTNNYSTAPILYFGSTSTANAAVRDWAIGPADSTYGYFHIFQGASTGASPLATSNAKFTINSSGDVGIGTATPGQGSTALTTLTVDGSLMTTNTDTSSIVYVYEQRFNGSNNLTLGYTANGSTHTAAQIGAQNNLPLVFNTGASERMKIDSAGDITMSGTGSLKVPSGTTAQRPTGAEGMIRYNTTEDYIEYYNGDAWLSTSETGLVASGGAESNVTISGIVYKLHTFTSSGTLTVSSGGYFEYLIISGGGGGGCGTAGGGGAGGYRTNVSGQSSGGGGSAEGTAQLSAGSHTITIGAGGAGAVTNSSDATNGGNTSVGSIVQASGGGAGGEGNPNNTRRAGQPGGSGGGAWEYSGDSGGAGSGTSGQGYAGGSSALTGGAGGGGAGGTAGAHSTNTQNSDGGPGVSSNINGTATGRAGGGGGGLSGQSSASDGGGAGANGSATGSSGTANTGGGGGGGWAYASGNGGSGGSGLVIIRYRI